MSKVAWVGERTVVETDNVGDGPRGMSGDGFISWEFLKHTPQGRRAERVFSNTPPHLTSSLGGDDADR